MAVTPTQVQQIINQNSAMQGGQPFGRGGTGMTQQEAQQTDANGNPATIPGTSGNWYSPQEILDARFAYDSNTATPEQATLLADVGYITDAQARTYAAAAQTRQTAVKTPPTTASGLYPYDPQTGQISTQPAQSPIGTSSVEAGTGQQIYIDPQTGILYDSRGVALPQWMQKSLGANISGGGGAAAADHTASILAAQTAASQLAEQQRQFDIAQAERLREFGITNPQEELQRQQGYLQQRAGTGLQLGDLQRSLANDTYQRALDPGNFPAYLAASAGLPQGRGAIDQLLGSGAQINPPAGSNPLADPRFQSLIDELYGYAKPTSLSTVQQIAAQNGGQLPQSFYDYTGTQNPNVQQHAAGGSQMLHEPVVGIGLHSGQPQFLAGEAGPERLQFQPTTHSHSDGGMPIPHSHADGHKSHDHMDANSPARYAEGGTADIQPYGYDQPNPDYERVKQAYATNPEAAQRFFSQSPENLAAMFGTPGGTYTPAQGTAIALGKGLQQLGWVPQPLVQQLLAGNAPTPGSVDEATLMRLPPSYRQLLQAAIRARVGTAGLQDYGQSQQQYALPGMGTSFATASYQ